nr:alpha/beta fold hydrolase [Ardenticatena sp.]
MTIFNAADFNPGADLSRATPFHLAGTSGVACLLIHGLTSTPYEVRELGERLHACGHTVAAPLLPGHGTSMEDLRRRRWQEWAEHIQTCARRLRNTHTHLFVIGSSLGAGLALWLALHEPLSGFVGLGTPYRLRWPTYAAYILQYMTPILPKRGGASIRNPDARHRHPSYVGIPARSMLEMMRLLATVRPRLHEIETPALLIHASRDHVLPASGARAVYDRLASKRKYLVFLENSDHIVSEDYEKEMVFALCQTFIEQMI